MNEKIGTMELIYLDDGMMKAQGRCRITKEIYVTNKFSYDGYFLWKDGTIIQSALHELDEDDREFLMTQTSPKGWDKIFGSKETHNNPEY